MRFALPTLLAALTACATSPPAPQPTPADVAAPVVCIPEGCGRDLSGTYVHTQDARYRYVARDDGTRLRLEVQVGSSPAPLPLQLELVRSPSGFQGVTRAFGYSARGAHCPVTFPTEVLACPEGGLTLRASPAVAIDDECNAVDPAPPATFVTHELKVVTDPSPSRPSGS